MMFWSSPPNPMESRLPSFSPSSFRPSHPPSGLPPSPPPSSSPSLPSFLSFFFLPSPSVSLSLSPTFLTNALTLYCTDWPLLRLFASRFSWGGSRGFWRPRQLSPHRNLELLQKRLAFNIESESHTGLISRVSFCVFYVVIPFITASTANRPAGGGEIPNKSDQTSFDTA